MLHLGMVKGVIAAVAQIVADHAAAQAGQVAQAA